MYESNGIAGPVEPGGILFLLAGIYCLCNPDVGLLSLSLYLGIVMLISGIIDIVVFAVSSRYAAGAGWFLADGILTVLLSLFLLFNQAFIVLSLPDYMSSLTVLIKTPGSTMSDILNTGLEMLGCTLASAVLCVVCGFLTARVAAGYSYAIREDVFHKIADFAQQEMTACSVPSLINHTTNDISPRCRCWCP